jgi:pyruvate/2-oxoglutarate dehydrogenase complex dihydrolipoamide dehydrogenase (E3) component
MAEPERYDAVVLGSGVRAPDLVRHAAQFGITTGPVAVHKAQVQQRKRDIVDGLIAMHLGRYQDSGAGLVMGSGRFVAPRTLAVRLNDGGERMLAGEGMFLNVRTHATLPDVPGLAATGPLTHIKALDLGRLPSHLLVLGGGYVGLEVGQAYRRFGSRVTIFNRGPRLASREDPGVAVRVGTLPIGAVLWTRTMAPTRRFMKALVGVTDDRILASP